MAASPLLKVAGAATLTLWSAGAAVFVVKRSNIEAEQSRLATEHDTMSARLAQLRAERVALEAQAAEEAETTVSRIGAQHVLWADRTVRYGDAIDDARAAIGALPEACGILDNLADHYKHMTKYMPSFFRYDMLSSRTHAFGLLVGSAATGGLDEDLAPASSSTLPPLPLASNVDVLSSVLPKDPLVNLIISTLDAPPPKEWRDLVNAGSAAGEDDDLLPGAEHGGARNIAELSRVFSASRRYFDDSIDAYNTQVRAAKEKQATLDRLAAGEHVPFLAGHLSHAARWVFDWVRVPDPEVVEAQKAAKQEEIKFLERRAEAYNLRTQDDVMAALVQCGRVKQAMRRQDGDGWSTDRHITRSLAAMDVWAKEAERYLADDQSRRALRAWHTIVAAPLLHIQSSSDEKEMRGGSA